MQLVIAFLGLLALLPAACRAQGLAITQAKIYPSPTEPAIADGVVLLRDGKIERVGAALAVPDGYERIAAGGAAVVAGLWNSHVHFAERKWVGSAGIPAAELTQQIEEMLTRYGFTHVFDTGSVWRETEAIRARVESGEVPGPKIFTAGGILSPRAVCPRRSSSSPSGSWPRE
jgi:imidazolonepropionase-like amidohydrolase